MLSFLEINFYGETFNDEQVVAAFEQKMRQTSNENKSIIIDISSTNLTDELLNRLLPSLMIPEVIELRLDDNPITTRGFIALCKALSTKNLPLKALSVRNIPIGIEGAQALIKLLSENYPFQTLDLHSCQIPEESITSIASSLKNHTHLKNLYLNYNPVKTGITAIAQMLYSNKTLEHLELACCDLDKASAVLFAVILEFNTGLRTINISENNFSNDFMDKLVNSISTNNIITKYFGPDTSEHIIAGYCYRNLLLPSNARWLATYNPEATPVQRSTELITDTLPDHTSSLLYRSGRNAILNGSLTSKTIQDSPNGHQPYELATTLYDNIYNEATQKKPSFNPRKPKK